MGDFLNQSTVTKEFFRTLPKKRLEDFRLWCLKNGRIMRRAHLLSNNMDYLQKLWTEYNSSCVINPYQKLEQQNAALRECIKELLPYVESYEFFPQMADEKGWHETRKRVVAKAKSMTPIKSN